LTRANFRVALEPHLRRFP